MSRNQIALASVLAALLLATLLVSVWQIGRRSGSPSLSRAPTSPALKEFQGELRTVAKGETVYVPVYSHIYASGGSEQLLEATLSIRNTDLHEAIIIKSIRYYDTEGLELREYLPESIILPPLASTDFLVEQRDRAGGAGANFLIDWVAETSVTEPVIEAVMVGFEDNRAFAFARPGYPLHKFPRNQANRNF